LNALRSSFLRILMAALLPFLAATSAIAATGMVSPPTHPAAIEAMVGMPDCSEQSGEHRRQVPRCFFDCPLVCGAVPPRPASAGEPTTPSVPAAFQIIHTRGEGISVPPDDPPPR